MDGCYLQQTCCTVETIRTENALFLNVRQELEVMRARVSLRSHWLVIELHRT